MSKKTVGTKKRGRPRKADAMTPQQRKQKLRDKRPEYEAVQKERERQADDVLRFHIRRRVLGNIPIPDYIDTECPRFQRALEAYEATLTQPVEVEEVVADRSKHPHY